MNLQQHLESIGACVGARRWAGTRTATATWQECQRPEWLIWWAAKTPVNSHAHLVLAACACARTALKYVPPGEKRPRLAIEAAEKWAAHPTEENRVAAVEAAVAAKAAAVAAKADAVAYAVAYAVAAKAAAYAVAYAVVADAVADAVAYAVAADAVAYAVAYAVAADAKAGKEMCSLIRSILRQPWTWTEDGA